MSALQSLELALRWYLVVAALSWAMYPLLYGCLGGLSDRGLGLVRPLGLLAAVGLPWWLSALGLLRFTDAIIIVMVGLVALSTWVVAVTKSRILGWLARSWRTLLAYEGAAALLFFSYTLWRCYNPAIAYTEKPMELGLLSSAYRATSMPPPDVWFAGKPVNYYYLGYVLYAVPARLARIEPSVAFNLALATVFASAVIAAVSVARNLAHALGAGSRVAAVSGVLGAIFLVGIGNLVTPIRLLEHPIATLHAGWWQGAGWQASRVVVDHDITGAPQQTINEFPAFSFVLGDLHPHLLALPLFISALGVGLAIACARSRRDELAAVALAGVVAGCLYSVNSWDMPPSVAAGAVGIASASCLIWSARTLRRLTLLLGAAIASALPFALHYVPAVGLQPDEIPAVIRGTPVLGKLVQTIGIVGWPKSSATQLLEVHGLFLLISAVILARLYRRSGVSERVRPQMIVVGLVVAAFLAWAVRFPALVLFGAPLALSAEIFFRGRLDRSSRFTVGLLTLTFALLFATEIVFLQDAFHNRMNTVFKLYFEAWTLFSVVGAAATPLAIRWLARRFSRSTALASASVLAMLVVACAVYPPLSAYRWADGLQQFQGLDGLAYMRQVAPYDAAAIDWLNAHARESQHVLEGAGCSYGISGGEPENRVSLATGLPTPIGWDFHEYQWRNGEPEAGAAIAQRQADVKSIYDDPLSAKSRSLLDRYGITYIYVGAFERSGYFDHCSAGPPYSAEGLAALPRLGWPVVFQQGDVTIYARPGSVVAD